MSQLFPNYTRLPLEIAAGEGSYVTDTQGRTYLDFTSGIGVVNLGYGQPDVQQAMQQQAEKLWHVP
jgi:acetylornithine/N-succinyldiaminopimelate aminotransferase